MSEVYTAPDGTKGKLCPECNTPMRYMDVDKDEPYWLCIACRYTEQDFEDEGNRKTRDVTNMIAEDAERFCQRVDGKFKRTHDGRILVIWDEKETAYEDGGW